MPDDQVVQQNQPGQGVGDDQQQQEVANDQQQQIEQQMQPIEAGDNQNENLENGGGAGDDQQEGVPAGAGQQAGAPANDQQEGVPAGAPANDQQAGAPANDQQENQEEVAEDQRIQEEAQREGGQNGRPAGNEQDLAQDEFNQNIVDAARNAGVDENQPQAEADPNRAFDTLEDLKELAAEQNQAGGNGERSDVEKLRENVMKFRKGNLYKAVIYAKMLENGEQPGDANKELNKIKPGASGSRFSRFLNASSIVNSTGLDKAGQVTKMVNAASGLVGLASDKYKKSRLSGLITLASDVMVLVNSVRSLLKKLATFKKTNTSIRKKVFGVISIASDFFMAVSKGAAIAKTIAGKLGKGEGLFAKIMGHLSNFSAMAGQLTGLAGVINTLQELDSNKRKLKKAQKEEEVEVENILSRLDSGENQQDAEPGNAQAQENAGQGNAVPGNEEPGNEEPGNAVQENAAQENAAQGNAGQGNAQAPPKKRRRLDLRRKKHLKEKIYAAMDRPELTADDKTVLASYLGRERTIAKTKLALTNVSHGLITLILGLGATGSKTAMDLSKENSNDYLRSGMSAKVLGGAVNSATLLFAAGGHIGKTATDSGRDEGEANFVKDAFWGTLQNMAGDDKYGLRKVAANLAPENPGNEAISAANTAVDKYVNVTKQFVGSGVNFAKLFEANDVETFKEALASGL